MESRNPTRSPARRTNRRIIATAFLFLVSLSFAFSISAGISYYSGDSIFSLYNDDFTKSWLELSAGIEYKTENFIFKFSMSASNDGRFESGFGDYYAGLYPLQKEGYLSFKFDRFSITLGRNYHKDIVDSPYSLFISSVAYLPRLNLDFTYEDEFFGYTTRWIQLAKSEDQSFLKSAYYRTYFLKFNQIGFRFGYQENNVVYGELFNFNYFSNPIPGFFIQYEGTVGRPYPEEKESNFMVGFFADLKNDSLYTYAQIMVDDINMNRFLFPDRYQNPDKIAWSIGGKLKTNLGYFGLYHAGATKYTFQPSSENAPQKYYGYTYWNDFEYNVLNKKMYLPPELMYAGYLYGENNLAFLITFEPKQIDSKFFLEYVALGERSPINPWGARNDYISGTHLLKDPDNEVVEHRVIVNTVGNVFLNEYLKLLLDLSAGYIFNSSEIVEVDSDSTKKPLLRPKEGNNFPIFTLGVGMQAKF